MSIGAVLDTLKNIWGFLTDNFAKIAAAVCPIFGLVYYWDDMVALIKNGLDDLHAYLVTLSAQGSSAFTALGSHFGFANNIFPIVEVFAMLAMWIGLRVVCIVIRLIKGIIPTLG